LWANVASVPDFFSGLPETPDARKLWDLADANGKARILTALSKSLDSCLAQKLSWVKVFGIDIDRVTAVTGRKNKVLYCQPGDVLIDDLKENIEAWESAGGRGILYTGLSSAESAIVAHEPSKMALSSTDRLAKRRQETPTIAQARQEMQSAVLHFFQRTAHEIATAIRSRHEKLAKGTQDIESFLRSLPDVNWESLIPDLSRSLKTVSREAGARALADLEITDQEMLSDVNDVAADWADQRAAELVGMRRLASGRLVQNPDAQWNIADKTRDDLRDIIADAFEHKTDMQDLADEIQQAGAFSEYRAGMIAATEVVRAENQGNLAGWKTSGQVQQIGIALSGDHDQDDECDDAADNGPYGIDDPDLPELPLHPFCLCDYSIAQLAGQDEPEDD